MRTGWRPLPADRALWTKYFEAARAALGDTAWGEAAANGRDTSPYRETSVAMVVA